jgi:helicase required for RNAi-mediated heterochromatin assembly 1
MSLQFTTQAKYLCSFPLSEKICNLNTDIGIPNYVKTQPMRGFRSLSQVPDREANKCDILQQWPPSPMGILDDSQWLALREMITKELAIIQGPPGTGKTFTSLAALKFMLENKGPDDPPIVIAAQTNHALDQLIKQVAEFEKNYVRMGSRSTESEIRKHTLFELRRENLVPRVTGGVWQAGKQQHKRLAKVIAEVLKPLTQVNSDQPLKAAMLLEYGLLRQDQVDSLIKKARDWERGGTVTDPLHAWLGTTVTEFRYPYTGNFGFDNDERVLEYEQLREIEMENGGHEEDWAALKDHFISIATGFCGESEDQIPLSKMRSYLEETDLWKVPRRYRGIIYDYFRKQVIAIVLENFSRFREEYEDCTEKFHLGRCERDYPALRDTNLIGLTTTGLSKYRAVLASVKPRVILIEEAAEVIEAPVAVACLPSLQQLILVGDHRQLRGRCAVDELSMAPFNLEVSMFERLVDNGMGFTMLQEQRRMIPEIRQLVAPLYGNTLRDHASVGDRPLIPGMGELRSYFFQHTSHESNDSLSSYFNEFEASMVIGLLGHLLKNRVPPTHITILTFYQGQRKLIKRKQDKNIDTVHHVQIATVDAYQGEENDIILLSLVRSNEHRGIGFLQQINRACVALSRAKSGLFIFGNAKCIVGYNPFWKTVIDQMRKAMPCRIGRALPLFCDRHDVQTLIKSKPIPPKGLYVIKTGPINIFSLNRCRRLGQD